MSLGGWRAHVLVLVLLSVGRISADAQLLSAYEQAYGPWDVRLTKNAFARRKWHLRTVDRDGGGAARRREGGGGRREDGDLQLFFPETLIRPDPSLSTTESDDAQHDDATQLQSRNDVQVHTTTKSVRSISCILNLEKNGRFSLSLLRDDKGYRGGGRHDGYSAPSSAHESHPTSTMHQPLRGEWFLTPNPYCVTDRHHDTLLLVSEPRMRRRSSVVEKATVELRCDVWGRYGMGSVRKRIGLGHGRVRGRMTRGTIIVVKEEVDDGNVRKKPPTREVVGTFCGRAIIDLGSADGGSSSCADGVVSGDNEEEDGDSSDDDDLDFGDNFDEFGVLRPIANR